MILPPVSAEDTLENSFVPLDLSQMASQTSDAPEVNVNCENQKYVCTIQVRKGPAYTLNGAPYDQESEAQFLSFSPEEKAKFLKRRKAFLKFASVVLHNTRIVYGLGSVASGAIHKIMQFVRPTNIKKNFNRMLAGWAKIAQPAGLPEDLPRPWFAQPIEEVAIAALTHELSKEGSHPSPAAPTKSIYERYRNLSRQLVDNALHTLDRQLWKQSRLVLTFNGFATTMKWGLIGMKTYGGESGKSLLQVGLTIGYSHASKSIVFDFYRQPEKLDRSLSPVGLFLYGLLPKFGFAAFSEQRDNKNIVRSGHTFYGPGLPIPAIYTPFLPIPFVPIPSPYITTATNYFEIGGYFGHLALPPPPISDPFSFLTKFSEGDALRITVSPFVPGFIRFRYASVKNKEAQAHLQSFANLHEEIRLLDQSVPRLQTSLNNSDIDENQAKCQKILGAG